jgi:hypothetical protein
MKPSSSDFREEGVSSLIEYLQITGMLLLFIVIILLSVYPVFIHNPLYTLTHHSYIDVGNGVSTRMVDLYVISPYVQNKEGLVVTDFDIPDDVAGRGYIVEVIPSAQGRGDDVLVISGDLLESEVPLAGIGSTLALKGRTASSGMNQPLINSESGVSETIGFILIFGIMTAGIALVTLYGYPMLLQQQQNTNIMNMERSMIVIQNDLKALTYKSVPYKETSLQVAGGTLWVQKDPVTDTKFTVTVSGQPYIFPTGEIHFESQDAMATVSLENGAVHYTQWSSPNGSVMIAEPRWFYDEPTKTFVMSFITMNATDYFAQTGIGTVRMKLTNSTQYGPFTVAGNAVTVKYEGNVQNNYNVAWRNYFGSDALDMVPVDITSNLESTYHLPDLATTLIIKTYNVTVLSL